MRRGDETLKGIREMFAELDGYDLMWEALEREATWRQARVEIVRQWRLRNPERARENGRRSQAMQRARGDDWQSRNRKLALEGRRKRYASTKDERREELRRQWREAQRRRRAKR